MKQKLLKYNSYLICALFAVCGAFCMGSSLFEADMHFNAHRLSTASGQEIGAFVHSGFLGDVYGSEGFLSISLIAVVLLLLVSLAVALIYRGHISKISYVSVSLSVLVFALADFAFLFINGSNIANTIVFSAIFILTLAYYTFTLVRLVRDIKKIPE